MNSQIGTIWPTPFPFQNGLVRSHLPERREISLWHNATRLTQTLNDAPKGFSGLSWHPQGQSLAAGGSQGELFIWAQTQAAKGFAKT